MIVPVISICIISYNQAAYIVQAIDSAINQKLNYSVEIIIADDYSTDGTRELIFEYANQYPDLIRVLPRTINLGPARNFVDLIYAANGKYIAYLEGDDYWTVDSKVQNQVDFLENNPDFAICFTDAIETFSEDINDPKNYLSGGSGGISETTINELIFRNYIQTCTVVFKNKLFGKFPDWYMQLKMGDWPLHLFNAAYGKIKYLNFVSAVHRNHSSGVWSSQHVLSRIYNTLTAYEVLELNTDFYKLSNFKRSKSNLYLSSVKYHLQQKEFVKAVNNFFKGVFLYPKHLYSRKKPV